MAGGRAVPLSDGCAHCLEPRRCLPSSEGREFVGCFACFSFSNRVKEDLILKRCSFPSLPFLGRGALLGGSCFAEPPGETGGLSLPNSRVRPSSV